MRAIILAAGVGNRMKPLTNDTHKTLLRIHDHTIIGRIVDGLHANHVTDITVVTGYLAESLQGYLQANYSHIGFHYVHNPRYEETNNVFSLSLAMNAREIEDDVILIESDLIYEASVIRKAIDSPYSTVALVDPFRSGMDGTVVTVEDNVITSIIPSHLQGKSFDFSGKYKTLNIYKFSRDFCNKTFKPLLTYYAQVVDDNSYYELILGILIYIQKETIHAEIVFPSVWAEVDDANDLREAEFVFNREQRLDILNHACGGFWHQDVLDFCFMRNLHFPTAAMVSELRNDLPRLLQNYGSRQSILNQKLSYFLLCSTERVHLLNGATQAFPILQDWFGGRSALVPRPTFGEYARLFPQADTYSDLVGLDCAEIEQKAQGARVVVFINPNTPTGSTLDQAWIHQFARARPDRTVMVDESFIDFSGQPSMVGMLEADPLDNVVVLKSLSKVLGVPGLRLGFLYSSDLHFGRFVHDRLPIWNCNSLAECFLELLLKNRLSLARSLELTRSDREAMVRDLEQVPMVRRVYPSGGNFLLVEFRPEAGSMTSLARQLLATRSIYVKDVTDRFPADRSFLRLAVRTARENQILMDALQASFVAAAPIMVQ